MIEGVFQREAPPDWIPVLTHGMHWGYGHCVGCGVRIDPGTPRERPLRGALAFATGVWTISYVQLVPMGLYEPPWRYPPKELALDLSYHLAYGAGLASRMWHSTAAEPARCAATVRRPTVNRSTASRLEA